jgi:adenine-specific DNA-methyltransferase
MAMKVFKALPAYLGGKRRLLGPIFRDLPLAGDAPVFVDPFLGGGSVSLYAKARGYRVVCSDLALRSFIIGKALIENDHVELTHDDLVRLYVHQDRRTFAEEHLAPHTFPVEHARFLDTLLANAELFEGPKGWLARLLAVKIALRLRPMGNFGAKRIMLQAAGGEWEDMNPAYVRDLATRGVSRHPLRVATAVRQQINRGVFANGLENEANLGDAITFLQSVQGNICYMDPPYSGTQSYESSLKPLDELLAGCALEVESNPFSKQAPEDVLPPLLEAADHIPTWALSYGNKAIDLAGLMDIVRQYRPVVEGRAIKYAHCSGLAGEESRERNQELLVIGRMA